MERLDDLDKSQQQAAIAMLRQLVTIWDEGGEFADIGEAVCPLVREARRWLELFDRDARDQAGIDELAELYGPADG